MATSPFEVRQSFPKPNEWDGLVTAVDSAYNPNRPDSEQTDALDALWYAAHSLDMEVIERNRYFGVGRAICSIAESSFKPIDDPESIANITASAMVRNHKSFCEFSTTGQLGADTGLYLTEIVSSQINDTPPHILAKYRSMSWAERTVINGIQLAHHDKIDWQDLADPIAGYAREIILENDGGLLGPLATVYSAASDLLLQSLILYCREKGMNTSGIFNPPLKDIVSAEELPRFLPTSTAARACTFRLDEIGDLPTYLKIDRETGQPYIDRSLIPKIPPKLSDRARALIFHEQRIGCPALFVGGAISYATESYPQAINRVQERLLNQPAQLPPRAQLALPAAPTNTHLPS